MLPGKDWTNNVSVGKLYLNSGQQIMMTIIENKHAHIYINHHKVKKGIGQDDGDLYLKTTLL